MKKIKETDQWGPLDGKLLYPSVWFYPSSKLLMKKTGVHWPPFWGVFDHDRMIFYWEKDQMQLRGEIALNKIILKKQKSNYFWKKYLFACEHVLKNAKLKIPLEEKFQKILPHLYDIWCYALVAEVANYAAPEFLRKKLKRYIPSDQLEHALEIMMAPEQLSFLQRGERALLQIALKVKGKMQLEKALINYTKKWYWLENNYFENKRLTSDYFLKQLTSQSKQELKKRYKEICTHEAGVLQTKKGLAKKYSIPQKLMQDIHAISFSLFWQDHRKATTWELYSFLDEMIIETGKKYNVKSSDLYYYTSPEWLLLLTNHKIIKPQIIKNRKKFFAVFVDHKDYKFFYGQDAEKIQRLFSTEKFEISDFVKGIVVSRTQKNVITGKARILLTPRDSHKMQKGEILIAPMTSPDYIVVMRKAKAIVTDVGGLMSHAAVVSRELKIPCIVGTKFATKVFKDGDLVEVDAERGIVRKVKSNK